MILPWVAVAGVLLAFSLSNDLPQPAVRRAFLIGGLLLPALTAVWAAASETVQRTDALVAAAPLVFLLVHHVLRSTFRRFTGEAPIVVSPGARRATGSRFFGEAVNRRVTFMDYLFTFLLGVGMLLVVGGALALRSS